MKLDLKLIGYINVFEKRTKALVKDCFIDNNNILIFVVKFGFGSKAIGNGGVVVKKMRDVFKRRIKIIEFNPNVIRFVKNVIYPLKPNDISLKDNNVVIKAENTSQRALLIGRNKNNLKGLQKLIDKYFKNRVVIE